ncbi:MAG TPA: glycerophosphodiester phosphodiesterase family protein [Devosiaceae bacterium]|jgi:glycerophosphoryl diester phosphodiesterase|nr:glycerophosphodiester phosphodiesterase family protein [Devosiaceae bacterium]
MPPRPRFDRPIAHRGLHDRAAGVIENSRTAFEAAIARGFTIECDLQLSSDGEAIVFHDDALARLTGTEGLVHDRTVGELTKLPLLGSSAGDCPQRFEDFLDQVAGRTLLQIELKRQRDWRSTRQLAARAAAALAAYQGPVTVESFDPEMLVAIRDCGYAGPLGIITQGYDDEASERKLDSGDRARLRHLLHWPRTRFDFISCDVQALGLPAVKFFRAFGMPVTAWTVRSPDEARLARTGADQIVFEGFDPDSA